MIKIELLKQHPSMIPMLANMWHELLGRIWVHDVPIERVITRFHEHLNDDAMPITLVALEGDTPVGMCSLRENDGIRPDLMPWLGSLIVDKSYQGRGIGQLLMNAIKDKAKELGFDKLYLFTFDPTLPEYYQRNGWTSMGMDIFKSHDVKVMMIDL